MRGRARIVIVGVVLSVALLAIYFFLVRPRQGELRDLRAQVEAESATTTALQLELQRLQSLEENAPQLEAELAAIRELVPREHDIANFLLLVQDAADEAGVDFVDITPELPKQPPEGAPLAEVRVAIGAGGGYFAVQDFLRRLYELERALRVDLLSLSGSTDPGTNDTEVEVALTARIFFELPATGASSGAVPPPTSEVGTPSPGATAPAGSPTPGAPEQNPAT